MNRMIKALFPLNFIVLLPLFFFSCKELGKPSGSNHEFTNALIHETSPYLLQHAHNPVNWRVWSQQAFDDAKKGNKLVLVSIGYSSCHWCHVMEEETFENPEVAKLMNENYVSIKVDREERPDVDHIYQTAIQLVKGNGGWPLNAIVLPNGKPLYLGTYHTKEQWNQILDKMNSLYHDDPAKAEEYAEMLSQGIQEVNVVSSVDGQALSKSMVGQSVEKWRPNWDYEWGGDKQVQKFMIPVNLDFLIDYAILNEDESSKAYIKNTLDKIIMGGIYDQIGGGFFRYSIDAQWKVPHFEKMLYDNAQALSLYSKAYQVFKDPKYKNVVFETIAYLEREMKNTEGGYFAALDADSEGEEGRFYVWKETELKSALGDDFELFSKYYGIQKDKVWEEGNYVLHKLIDDTTFAEQNNIAAKDLDANKANWKDKLLMVRQKRIRPNTDDKIITSWNALLINGYADAYKAFGEKVFLERAENIIRFIREKSLNGDHLIHTFKKGGRRIDGFLEDYAFLIDASLNLYSVTLDGQYLDLARNLNKRVEAEFSDEVSVMFRYNENRDLISKIIKTNDGVLPSPNAVTAHNFFKLGHILYDNDFLEKSKAMLSSMVPMVASGASSYAKWNSLLLYRTYPYFEIAVVGNNAEGLVKDLHQTYVPNTLVVGSNEESDLPLFKNRYDESNTYIYVCQNSTCKLPVETVEAALGQLNDF